MAILNYKSQVDKLAKIKANTGLGAAAAVGMAATQQPTTTTKTVAPAYGSNIANFDPNDETQRRIADLGQQWAAAKGNKTLQDQLHAQADALRGGGGSYNAATGVHTFAPPQQQMVAGPSTQVTQGSTQGTQSTQGTAQSLIDQLNEARRNQVLADLGKSRDNALSNLSGERSAIAPKYYDQRNQVAAGAQQQARNFAEFMAARGGTSSGANAQAELSRNMTTQGNLGSLGRQEAADFSDIERRTTGVNNAFESDVASTNAGLEGDKMQALLSDYYTQQQRELQIAELMGAFQGQRTLAGTSQDQNYGLNLAQLSGQLPGGGQTLAARQFDANQGQQTWENKFNYGQATGTFGNGKQTLQNQQFQYGKDRDEVSDQQWQDEFNQRVKQDGVQNALAWAQNSISQQNANTSSSNASWSRDPNNPDNIYKQLQIDNFGQEDKPESQRAEDYYSYIDSSPTAFTKDEDGVPTQNNQVIESMILDSGLTESEMIKLYRRYGIPME